MEKQEFFSMLIPPAKTVCASYDLPWQVVVAQGALESGWGTSELSTVNNFFGRKWDNSGDYYEKWTKEIEDGEEVDVLAKFKVYKTLDDAIIDWCTKICVKPWYSHALQYRKDPVEFLRALGPIYSTKGEEYFNLVCPILKELLEGNY